VRDTALLMRNLDAVVTSVDVLRPPSSQGATPHRNTHAHTEHILATAEDTEKTSRLLMDTGSSHV